MNEDDNIETYLGNTHHKNLYFNGKIPPAWVFKSYHIDLQQAVHQTISPVKPGVSYTINNLGYHSDFDYDDSLHNKSNILCLGDSNTFGLLLDKSHIWPTRLAQLCGNKHTVLNFGLPGGSGDTAARIGVNTIMALGYSIKAVLVVWPSYSRREFASNKFHSMVYRTPNDDQLVPYDQYWDFIDWRANSYNFYKNKILLESICDSYDIKFVDLEIDDDFHLHKQDTLETYGQMEVNSFGIKTHDAIANYFYKRLA